MDFALGPPWKGNEKLKILATNEDSKDRKKWEEVEKKLIGLGKDLQSSRVANS